MDTGTTLWVRLAAHLGDLGPGLTRGAAMVSAYGSKVDKQFASMESYAKKNQAELHSLGNVAGGVGLAAAVGIGVAISKFAEFDKQMSSVQAATHASENEMAALRAEAIKLGADTKFSATEAAQGIEELAKAGVSTQEILNGALQGSLDLAAAGDLSVAQAAEIAATAKTQFDLMGTDIPHLADLLAAGAGKAQGSVTDLGAALGQTGLVTSGMGLSIEDTTGTLAAFASAGLIGSDAGTAFKTMIQRLQAPMGRGAQALDQYGISAYDLQGNFVGITDAAGQLQEKLAHLTQQERDAALAQIFGADAIRAATVLYKQGETGIQGWIDKTNDAGFAAETARLRTDNLSGDIERLGGSLDSLFIGMGSGANGPLREFVQMLEVIVDMAGSVPDPLMAAAVAGLALTAMLGGGVFVATRFVGAVGQTRANIALLRAQAAATIPTLQNFGTALYRLGQSAQHADARTLAARQNIAKFRPVLMGTAGALGAAALGATELDEQLGLSNTAMFGLMGAMGGPLGVAAGSAVGFLMDVKSASKGMSAEFEDAQKTLEKAPDLTGQLEALQEMKKARRAILDDSMNPAEALGVGAKFLVGRGNVFNQQRKEVEQATDAVAKYKAGVGSMLRDTFGAKDNLLFSKDYSVQELQDFVSEVGPILQKAGLDAKEVFSEGVTGEHWSEATAAINEYRASTESVVGRTAAVGEALAAVDDSLVTTAMSTKDLEKALEGLFSPTMDMDAAIQKWRDGLEDLRGELQKNGTALDDETEKGRANKALVREQIDNLKGQMVAASGAGHSSEYLANMVERGRANLMEQAEAAGISSTAMAELLDYYNLTPEMLSTIIETPGAESSKNTVSDLGTALQVVDGEWVAKVSAPGADDAAEKVSKLRTLLDGMKLSYSANISVGVMAPKTPPKPNKDAQADGGYYPFGVPAAADGLFNDAHIQRAGQSVMRYAENETQGESFIPHAQAKRGRSTKILGQTASKFGYDLAPRGMQAAGRGGGTMVVHHHEGPLVSGLTMPLPAGNTPDDMLRPLVYELRKVQRGGKYN